MLAIHPIFRSFSVELYSNFFSEQSKQARSFFNINGPLPVGAFYLPPDESSGTFYLDRPVWGRYVVLFNLHRTSPPLAESRVGFCSSLIFGVNARPQLAATCSCSGDKLFCFYCAQICHGEIGHTVAVRPSHFVCLLVFAVSNWGRMAKEDSSSSTKTSIQSSLHRAVRVHRIRLSTCCHVSNIIG